MTKQAKRWEFVPNSEIKVDGHILRRIRALVNMPQYGVQAGDFGGYVEHEENLPQKSHAWIFHDAQVCNKARVFDNAWVSGYAQVCDNARVYSAARVFTMRRSGRQSRQRLLSASAGADSSPEIWRQAPQQQSAKRTALASPAGAK